MNLQTLFTIILQYNNADDTIELLQSIKNGGTLNLVIVDNGSDKANLQKIRDYTKNHDLKLLESPTNLGYAEGNNLGIKYALNNGADYILLLNNDTLVKDVDLFTKLTKFAESDEKIGIVCPVIKEPDKIVYGGKISWLKPRLNHIYSQATIKSNFYTPGACMLIKRKLIDEIGFLPNEYFLYFEDAAYCLKATKIGYKCEIEPKAEIYHQVSKSTSKLGNPLLLRYHYRNALYFNKKLGPWWAKTLVYPWSFYILGKQLLKISIGKNREISKEILAGVSDFYKNKMGKIA